MDRPSLRSLRGRVPDRCQRHSHDDGRHGAVSARVCTRERHARAEVSRTAGCRRTDSRTTDNPDGINIDAPFPLPAHIRGIELRKGEAVIVQ